MGTRAGNQRSSIFQGNDGCWYGFVTMGIRPDGSPDRRKRSGATRAEVVRKVRELERQRTEQSALPAGRSPRLEAWLTEWLSTSSTCTPCCSRAGSTPGRSTTCAGH